MKIINLILNLINESKAKSKYHQINIVINISKPNNTNNQINMSV